MHASHSLPKRILITAFEPFGGRSRNASAEAAHALMSHRADLVPALDLTLHLLPVATGEASRQLIALLDDLLPDFLLLLGEARRDAICLETTGYNERKFSIPDNRGQTVDGEPVNPSGAASYASTLPFATILAAIEAEGILVRFSDDPGRYLCNESLYSALDHITRNHLSIRAGFIHVPLLPETVAHPNDPAMPTEQIVRALLAALRCLTQPSAETA